MATRQTAVNCVKWVEGLRGLASVMVLITHVARAFDYALFFPRNEPDASPRILQLPVLRVPAQGRIGVPIFAFLTGFVCALKPLKLSQHRHQHGESLAAVARSAFRRPLRLILPATIATVISFLCTTLGGYRSAASSDSKWVRFDAPIQEPTFKLEVSRLLKTSLTTWTTGVNLYDRHQWALRPLLFGAFQVYLLVAVMVGMQLKYRIILHLILLLYWWLNQEAYTETFGSMITLGGLLADLSLHRRTQDFIAVHNRILSLVVAPVLIVCGLLIGSYPQEHEEYSRWSHWLHETFVAKAEDPGIEPTGSLLVPGGTDPQRRLTSAAIQLCAIAIFLSPKLRDALSHRYLLWLGQHSFAVYLVHGTILRSVGIWVAYGMWPENVVFHEDESRQEYTHIRSEACVYASVVVFIALSYISAWAWMRWVDSACASATKWLEDLVFQAEEERGDDKAERGCGVRHGLTEGPLRAASQPNGAALPV